MLSLLVLTAAMLIWIRPRPAQDSGRIVEPAQSPDTALLEETAETDARVKTEGADVTHTPGHIARMTAVPLLLIAGATFLWIWSLPQIDPGRMTDFGLVSVLPLSFYAALVLLVVSFALAVHDTRTPPALLLIHVALLDFVIHGTPAILYKTVRYSWTYKHIAIVDYIQRHGTVDPTISYLNAYHDWPGFFAAAALFTQAAGLKSALNYAGWAPVLFDFLYAAALYLVYRALTDDRRLVWLAIWFFSLGNWVGQDYFAPQAVAYFLFLVVVGVCLLAFRRTQASVVLAGRWRPLARWINGSALGATPRFGSDVARRSVQRVGLMIVVILSFFVIDSSHQLTPFMALSAVTLLAIFGLCSARDLPILMTVMIMLWTVYVAESFVLSNIHAILAYFGQLAGNIDAGLTPLSAIPPSQQLVARVARALTGLLLVLPILGLVRRIRSGIWDVACVLLILAPIPSVVATRYGHEILFRVFLFALPFTSFLLAALLYPRPRAGISRWTVPLSAALSVALVIGLCIANYGQESMNYFTPNEVAAVRYFDRVSPPQSMLVEGSYNTPIPFQNYELYTYLTISDQSDLKKRLSFVDRPVTVLLSSMKGYRHAYVMITRSQKAEVHVTGNLPAGSLDRIEQALSRSSSFRLIYRNPDAVIFERSTSQSAEEERNGVGSG